MSQLCEHKSFQAFDPISWKRVQKLVRMFMTPSSVDTNRSRSKRSRRFKQRVSCVIIVIIINMARVKRQRINRKLLWARSMLAARALQFGQRRSPSPWQRARQMQSCTTKNTHLTLCSWEIDGRGIYADKNDKIKGTTTQQEPRPALDTAGHHRSLHESLIQQSKTPLFIPSCSSHTHTNARAFLCERWCYRFQSRHHEQRSIGSIII